MPTQTITAKQIMQEVLAEYRHMIEQYPEDDRAHGKAFTKVISSHSPVKNLAVFTEDDYKVTPGCLNNSMVGHIVVVADDVAFFWPHDGSIYDYYVLTTIPSDIPEALYLEGSQFLAPPYQIGKTIKINLNPQDRLLFGSFVTSWRKQLSLPQQEAEYEKIPRHHATYLHRHLFGLLG